MKDRKWIAWLDPAIGTLICASLACLIAVVFYGLAAKAAIIPLVFLGVVIVISLRYGVLAGVFGTIAAALIFGFFLFRPHGSLVVLNGTARANLAWLVLGGCALSFLMAPSGGDRHRHDVQ